LLGASAGGGYIYRKSIAPNLQEEQSLNPYTFTPYTLVTKEAVSSTSSIFILRPKQCKGSTSQLVEEARKRGVWSIQAKQPQLQIGRSYTPLPDTDGPVKNDDMRILIRREQGGEVSNYLHNLPDYSSIDLRGPHLEVEIPQNVKQVLFLAGGTGIAPAMQVAEILAGRAGSKMHILWANRRREECVGGQNKANSRSNTQVLRSWIALFGFGATAQENSTSKSDSSPSLVVQGLQKLQNTSNGKINITYYVDEERRLIQSGDIEAHLKSLAQKADTANKLILISGPDGFVEHFAGKKTWQEGKEVQGPLGGVLAQINLSGWKVIKL
ncbi:hypothetical protein EJ08DRAFT_573749, partial [Tothia fuscella]